MSSDTTNEHLLDGLSAIIAANPDFFNGRAEWKAAVAWGDTELGFDAWLAQELAEEAEREDAHDAECTIEVYWDDEPQLGTVRMTAEEFAESESQYPDYVQTVVDALLADGHYDHPESCAHYTCADADKLRGQYADPRVQALLAARRV